MKFFQKPALAFVLLFIPALAFAQTVTLSPQQRADIQAGGAQGKASVQQILAIAGVNLTDPTALQAAVADIVADVSSNGDTQIVTAETVQAIAAIVVETVVETVAATPGGDTVAAAQAASAGVAQGAVIAAASTGGDSASIAQAAAAGATTGARTAANNTGSDLSSITSAASSGAQQGAQQGAEQTGQDTQAIAQAAVLGAQQGANNQNTNVGGNTPQPTTDELLPQQQSPNNWLIAVERNLNQIYPTSTPDTTILSLLPGGLGNVVSPTLTVTNPSLL